MATNKNFVVKNGLEVGGDIIVTGSLQTSVLTLPASDGTSGQVIVTDGSGNLSFQTIVSNFTISDGTNTDTFNTGETLTFTAGTGITTTVSNNVVTIEGVAQYDDADAVAAVESHPHLTIDGGTLYVDTANDYVGIGDTSPQHKLDVAGAIGVNGTEVIDSTSEVITAQLKDSGVTAGTYGSATFVPVITVDAKGRVTSASATTVAGVSSFTYNASSEVLNISTADGGSFNADISSLASQTYVDTAVAGLVDSAPGTLDTLNELAAALGDDPNFATTIATAINGKVNKTGDTMTGNLSFGDNNKAIFGAGSDLQIYHDGSNSYVGENGTGDLRLTGNSITMLKADATETYAQFLVNSAVNLFYDNSKKLATTSTGVDITGTLTSDGLTVDGGATINEKLIINKQGEALTLRSGGASTQNYISIGRTGEDARITMSGAANNGIQTSAAGDLVIGVNNNLVMGRIGSPYINLNSSGVVINEAGADRDFRVESDNNTHALFIQGSDGNVGIGTTVPSAKVDLVGGDVTGGLKISADKTTSAFFAFGADANETRITSTSYGGYKPLTVYTGGSERMRIDSSGRVGIATNGAVTDIPGTSHDTVVVGNNGMSASGVILNVANGSNSTFGFYDNTGTTPAARMLWDSSADKLHFYTRNSSANGEAVHMTIQDDGKVGIGATAPDAKLHVDGGIIAGVADTANSNYYGMLGIRALGSGLGGYGIHFASGFENPIIWGYNAGAPGRNIRFSTMTSGGDRTLGNGLTDRMVIDTNTGNVGINNNSPSEKLHVAGNILASGNITAYSDISLKDNITSIPNALDKVLQIRGVTYNRNDIEDNPRHTGVIAQEVEKVLPEVISESEDGIKSVAYGNMVGLLVEAIKELKAEIEELKGR